VPLPELSKGKIIGGDFEVERQIGSGAMGAVYLVHQRSTDQRRALKLMRLELGDDAELLKRFEQDATIGSQIDSEHFVEVIATGVDAETGLSWLAMEYLEGEDLRSRLQDRGALGTEEVLEVFRQLCDGLAVAHAAGIVHRDLKPQNIFLSRSAKADAKPEVKLLGLGLAKAVADTTTRTEPVGTLLCKAPEQLRGQSVSPATDVWALGLIAFELLSGKPYWKSAQASLDANELAEEIKGGICSIANSRAKAIGAKPLPGGFGDWLAKCCAVLPALRFADASEAFAALEPILENAARAPSPPAFSERAADETTVVRTKNQLSRGDEEGGGKSKGKADGEPPAAAPRSAPAWMAPALLAGAAALVILAIIVGGSALNDDGSAQKSNVPDPSALQEPEPQYTAVPPIVPMPEPPPRRPREPATNVALPDGGTAGYLTILCVPGCDSVQTGGRNLGPSPIVRAALPPGEHEVVLRAAGKSTKTLRVTLTEGQTTAKRVTMD